MKTCLAFAAAFLLPASLLCAQRVVSSNFAMPEAAASAGQQPGPPQDGNGPGGRESREEQAGPHDRGPEMRGLAMRDREMGDRGHGMGMHGEWWRNPELVTRLGLSSDQVKKLSDLALQNRIQSVRLHATVREEELRLQSVFESPTLDQRAADAQIDKTAEARATLEKTEAKAMLAERAVLTPDQWTKLHTPESRSMGGHAHNRPAPTPGAAGPMQPMQTP